MDHRPERPILILDAEPAEESQSGHSLPSFLVPAEDNTEKWAAWHAATTAWLESKRRKSGSDNTVKAYHTATRQFFAWAQARFVGLEPWSVHPGHAQEWAVYLSTRGRQKVDRDTGVVERVGLSDASVSLKLAALSSFYDYCQRRHMINTPEGPRPLWPVDRANPFAVVERPKISQYGRAKYPSTRELKAMLAACNDECLTGKRDLALLLTFATTCRRSSEVLNMRWGDIQELGDGAYSFYYRYKGGDIRRAVLMPEVYQAICTYLRADDRPPEHMEAEHYIWIPMNPERILSLQPDRQIDPNQPISNRQANAILKKYARRCDVDESKAHIHGLRHAGARLRAENMSKNGGSVDYMEIMQLLGHSSLAVTQIYSQKVLEDPKDPGGEAAVNALLPKNPRQPRRRPSAQQLSLEIDDAD